MREYKFIDKIGVELEGGWTDPDFLIGHDGSVNVRANVVGELASPILNPEDVEDWVTKHYPDAINNTCGLHVHISLKHVLHYSLLMERTFFDFFTKSLLAWGKEKNIIKSHPFWDRLAGTNRYCKNEFIPERQVFHKQRHENRYTMLNYTWAKFNTIECRVLPGFKMAKIGISAILKVMDLFEEYLASLKTRERAQTSEVVFEDDDVEKIELEGTIPLEDQNPSDVLLELEVVDDRISMNSEV